MASLLTLVLSAVIVLAGYTEVWALALAVVVVQLVGATAPPPRDLAGVQVGTTGFLPIALGSLVATALVAYPEALGGAEGTTAGAVADVADDVLIGIGPGVAVLLIAALFSQMRRKDGRRQLLLSLSHVVTIGVFLILLSAWVPVGHKGDGSQVIATAGAGVAAAAVAWLLPGSRALIGLLATLAGVAGGVAVAAFAADVVDVGFGAALGLAAGALTVVAKLTAETWFVDARARLAFEAVLPLALAAPVVLLVSYLYVF